MKKIEKIKHRINIWELAVFAIALFAEGIDGGILWILILILNRLIAHLNKQEK